MGRSVYILPVILVVVFVALAAAAQQFVLPETVLAWSAVALVALLSYRVVRLYRITRSNSQVVISNFGNSSGVAALDATMPGLSLLVRQGVLKEMLDLRDKVRVVSSDNDVLLKATLPSAALDTKLTDLTKALTEGSPENAKPAVQLLSLLLTPRGTMVVGQLQLGGDTPGQVGISLEVADIEGLKEPRSDTFWESLPADDRGEAGGVAASGLVAGRKDGSGTSAEGNGCMLRRFLAWLCACLCSDTVREDKGTVPKEATSEEAHVREARALFELGALYERRAAYEQAKTAYEEAAKKNPDHPAVREALLRVLKAPGRTPSERYRALLGPVSCWLAAELARDKMLAGLSWGSPTPHHDKAEVHNFVGSYLTYRDPDHGAFLRSAERELRLAINEDPGWYLPHDNLGDVLSYAGRQHDAIDSYSKALNLLGGPPTQKRALRIRLARDMAMLLSGEPALRSEASDDVGAIENDIDNVQDPDARFLYNLASWYAVSGSIAAEFGEEDANARVERARLLLSHALAMDDSGELQVWSEKDPDLAKLREGSAPLG